MRAFVESVRKPSRPALRAATIAFALTVATSGLARAQGWRWSSGTSSIATGRARR